MFSKKFVCCMTVATLLLPSSLPLMLRAKDTQTVVINELLWMGSPGSSADEWIELRNMTPEVVAIGGWKLTRRSSGQEITMLTLPGDALIEPRGYYLIANYGMDAPSTHLAVTPDLVDAAVSLLNSGLQLKLYDQNGGLIDTADDGSGTPFAGAYESGKTFAAMARNGIPGDGTVAERWHTSTTAINLTTDSIVRGTPRTANDNVPPVVPVQADQRAEVGVSVGFDATDAFDPDGDAIVIAWDFGDGTTDATMAPTHSFGRAGTYHGSLSASDQSVTTTTLFVVDIVEKVENVAALPAVIFTGTLTLNEVLPNPAGPDDGEFIECAAIGGVVDPNGWSVRDASGTTYTFKSAPVLELGTYRVLMRSETKIALNNDTDRVVLIRPDGTIAEEMSYAGAEEGYSYARAASGWAWTSSVTPGAANVIVKPNHAPRAAFSCTARKRAGEKVTCDGTDAEDPDGDVLHYAWEFGDGKKGSGRIAAHTYAEEGEFLVRLTVSDPSDASDVEEKKVTVRPALVTTLKKKPAVKGASTVRSIDAAGTADSGTPVVLSGVVSAPPNVIGEGVMYIADGAEGIAVRSSGVLPKFSIGDAVTVRGERRTKSGEAYILVSENDGIRSGHGNAIPVPSGVKASDIDDIVGSLVVVEGDLLGSSGGRLTIDDGSGEVVAYLRASTGIKKPALHVGDRVRIVGIVSRTSGGIRVLPRVAEDVILVSAAVVPASTNEVLPRTKRPTPWMYLLVGGGVIAGIGLGLWRKERLSDSSL